MTSSRMRRALCLIALTGGLGGCVEHRDGITGTQSIHVDLVSPTNPGDVMNRLDESQRTITVNLTALGPEGEPDPSFERDVQVYVQHLGTLTPSLKSAPLATIHLTAGKAMGKTVTLPPVYGPTTLWIDDGKHADPTYATGTSPTLWYRNPYIADLQRPVLETVSEALTESPLKDKQISVGGSRHGAVGRLVVTSVFSQGYTVSDVKCQDATGKPPCTASAYDHILVFSFSAPRDQEGRLLKQGQVIDGFSGGVQEFNGLTEIGFPATVATSDEVVPGREPDPASFDNNTWFKPISDPQGIINFERNEAGAIEIKDGVVCDLDDDYATYKQWKLDPSGAGGDCSSKRNVLNVITSGVVADFDPAAQVGKRLPRVVGVVRPVEIGTFYVWIIYPRSAADLTLQ